MDKDPMTETLCPDGVRRSIKNPKRIRRSGTKELFQGRELYTINLAYLREDFVETAFFGQIDHTGKKLISVFERWPETYPKPKFEDYPTELGNPAELMSELAGYINAQLLRTPRGLSYLNNDLNRFEIPEESKNDFLMARLVRRFRDLNAMMVEQHWQIYRKEVGSPGFLLSDEPVTFYNFRSYPSNPESQKNSFPSPFWRGTRILFPLSLNVLLVLSHKEHVDKPSARKSKNNRRNSRVGGSAIANYTGIERDKVLSNKEVCMVNYVIKKRSRRFIASACKDDLFPEKRVGKVRWSEVDKIFYPRFKSYHTSSEFFFETSDGLEYGYNAFGEEVPSKAKEMKAMLEKLLKEKDEN